MIGSISPVQTQFRIGIAKFLEAERYVQNRKLLSNIASPECLGLSAILELTSSKFQIQTSFTQSNCVIGQLHATNVQIFVRSASFDITFYFQNCRQSGYNRKRFTQAILQIR